MATTADRLTHLNVTKETIRQAIVAKGVAVPETTPFRQYATKIAAIPQEGGTTTPSDDGWTRPADRPAVPTVNENEIYMLFGVQPTGPNDYAITLTATGGYTVDWGDGTVETIASATKCEHMYNYSTLAVTPNSDGVKWVWIKFKSVSNPFTVINTNVRHSLRPSAASARIFVPQIYEIYLNAPDMNSWNGWSTTAYTRFLNLELFDWQGKNKLSSLAYFLCRSYKLKRFNLDTSYGSSFDYFLYQCYSFNQPLNINTSNGTTFANFMRECISFNQPLNINTSNGTDFSAFLYSCYSFNQLLNIDTSKGSNFNYFLYQCYSFNQPLNINTSNGTTFAGLLNYCYSFKFSVTVDLIKATTAIGLVFIGDYNYAQTGLHLLNMGSIHTALTISNSSLGVAELVLLFGDLYNRSSTTAGTLTITSVFGANQLTKAQLAIATAKNWTVTGASTID